MQKEHQLYVYMPNEIFDDLTQHIDKAAHRAFAYAYYYYASYLYRYCEYVQDEDKITQPQIKAKLGYSQNEKRLDYIVKQGGVLDTIGYTETTGSYPMSWEIDDNKVLHFMTLDDYKRLNGTSVIISEKNYKVKLPVKAFHRTTETLTEQLLDGTFYDIANTHRVSHKIFEICMSNAKQLGTMALYIYGYLKHKNDMYGDYRVSSRKLAVELGVSEPTLFKYISQMENASHSLIYVKHKKFVGEGGEANLYRALSQ